MSAQEDFSARAEFTDPAILRTNLASVVLQMMALGLGEIGQFPFVQPPDTRNINDALLLEELQAIKKARGMAACLYRKMVRYFHRSALRQTGVGGGRAWQRAGNHGDCGGP